MSRQPGQGVPFHQRGVSVPESWERAKREGVGSLDVRPTAATVKRVRGQGRYEVSLMGSFDVPDDRTDELRQLLEILGRFVRVDAPSSLGIPADRQRTDDTPSR